MLRKTSKTSNFSCTSKLLIPFQSKNSVIIYPKYQICTYIPPSINSQLSATNDLLLSFTNDFTIPARIVLQLSPPIDLSTSRWHTSCFIMKHTIIPLSFLLWKFKSLVTMSKETTCNVRKHERHTLQRNVTNLRVWFLLWTIINH